MGQTDPPFTAFLPRGRAGGPAGAAVVSTVLGPVEAGQIGVTLLCGSLLQVLPGAQDAFDIHIDRAEVFDILAARLEAFRRAGGGAIVGATGKFEGRDLRLCEALSRATGLHISASTGVVGGDTALPFFERASVEDLTDRFVHEIPLGIGRTGAKAGIIKVGIRRGFRMKALDKRICRAAARARRITGAPILTHLAVDCEPARAIFADEGLPCHRVLFVHADDAVSQGRVDEAAILAAGERIGFDTSGCDLELPDPPVRGRRRQERLDPFLRFLRAGLVDQVLAAADAKCSPLGWPGVTGHSVNSLFGTLLPDLRADGIDDATIDRLFAPNPAEFLTLLPIDAGWAGRAPGEGRS